MRWIMLAAALVVATPVEAHCYSVWRYPWPQRCGAARQIVRAKSVYFRLDPSISVPILDRPDIPLPSLAQADLVEPEADEATRAKVLLRAALELPDAR